MDNSTTKTFLRLPVIISLIFLLVAFTLPGVIIAHASHVPYNVGNHEDFTYPTQAFDNIKSQRKVTYWINSSDDSLHSYNNVYSTEKNGRYHSFSRTYFETKSPFLFGWGSWKKAPDSENDSGNIYGYATYTKPVKAQAIIFSGWTTNSDWKNYIKPIFDYGRNRLLGALHH